MNEMTVRRGEVGVTIGVPPANKPPDKTVVPKPHEPALLPSREPADRNLSSSLAVVDSEPLDSFAVSPVPTRKPTVPPWSTTTRWLTAKDYSVAGPRHPIEQSGSSPCRGGGGFRSIRTAIGGGVEDPDKDDCAMATTTMFRDLLLPIIYPLRPHLFHEH